MATLETRYLPVDRFKAIATGIDLPSSSTGSALFADISGFTPITEKLRQSFGVRRGAEALAIHLNRVYDALIAQVEQYGGSVVSFAGDAITCWFDGKDAAVRAAACAFALVEAMRGVETVDFPHGETAQIGLKVAIATGNARRFSIGDPTIQRLDALAGAPVARMAIGEGEAERGEVLVDMATAEALGAGTRVREWRSAEGERFAVLEGLDVVVSSPTSISTPIPAMNDSLIYPWLLPPIAQHFKAGLGEYLTELRPAVAVFVRIMGIDYDHDEGAEGKLDAFVRLMQEIVSRYEGNVLQLTIGDKGSYMYAAFGAPIAHEDDVARALEAALQIRERATALGYLEPLQMGISRGVMRTGAYGSETRRTYGVLGEEVNLAARLMMLAAPGEILGSNTLLSGLHGFALDMLSPVYVKGRSSPVGLFRLVERQERTFEGRFYTTPLIGRENDLTLIRSLMQPMFGGRHAGIIYIYGEAGMGKSRLAFEIQRRLQADTNAIWLTGQAESLERAPLSAFAYFLRPYFGQRGNREGNLDAFNAVFERLLRLADEATRADLFLYRSFLAGLVGLILPDSPFETADERLRIDNEIAAIKAWARAVCNSQPLVLHLEDANWLDASSIRALQELTFNLEFVPLMLILTSRYADDGTPVIISGIYSVPVHTIDLHALSDDSVRLVVEAILGTAVSEQLAQFIRERAQGNPFFTEQLALDLKERGVLVEVDERLDLQPETAAEVPTGVNAVLIARLDRLTAQVKAVVQTAAVLGREFDVQVLSHMLREGERAYIHIAEEEAIWTALDALRYLFRHALLRDAAYEMQVREHLIELHRLAAETIEALYPDDTRQYDALLEHWDAAGVMDKFQHYAVPVCERLVGITADYPRAQSLVEKALSEGETPERAALYRLLGDVMQLRGEYAIAIRQYEDCMQTQGVDETQRILALDGLGKVYTQQGDYLAAVRFAEQALELARDHQDRVGTARVLVTLGDIAFQQGDYSTSKTDFDESLSIFRQLGTHAGIVGALNRLGKIATLKGDKETARAYLQESLILCQEMGDRQQLGGILNNLGNLSLDLGDNQLTQSYYESSLRLRREIGDRNGVGGSLGNLALLMLRQGRIDDGLNYAEASLNERRAIGDRKGIANALSLLASVAYDRNDLAAAQRYLQESLEIQRAVNDRWGVGTTLTNLGEIARMREDYAAAETYVAEGLALYRQLEQPKDIADALTMQAWLAQVQGDLTTARQRYEEGLSIRREINAQRGIARSLLDLSSLDALMGLYEDAERRLTEALDIMQTMGDKNLSPSLAALANLKLKLGQPSTVVRSLMRDALTQVRSGGSPKAKLATLIEAALFLLENGQYAKAAELAGFIQVQPTSADSRQALNRLLNGFRDSFDASALEAALERGKTLQADEALDSLMTIFAEN